ncbi:hypothetical protein [Bradyrhizobium tunisiense]|uniref:hypothetical protein n=1 Tax=Bradyrhizobium tunisiense TaxID=3278709 RepID=UPI0035D5D896
MIPATIHHLHQIEGFLRRGIYLPRADDEQIRSHHATVKPMNGPASLDAADHADIRPIYLRDDIADEEFRKPIGVRNRSRRLLYHFHYTLPAALPATGNLGTELTRPSRAEMASPNFYGLFQIGNYAAGARA